jgi:AcrR family transcriptional regulator
MARKVANPGESGVRNRLLEAADRLFYTEGVRAVGIDRVLAEAEAAKASLYSHFGCKDELVAAYLERRVAAARASIDAFVSPVPPEERALRMFDWILEWVEAPEFRGCPMQHVVSEIADPAHPARLVAASQREWLFERFTEWAKAAGAPNPKALAGALVVLFDGAVAASEQDGPQRARDARWAAKALLER